MAKQTKKKTEAKPTSGTDIARGIAGGKSSKKTRALSVPLAPPKRDNSKFRGGRFAKPTYNCNVCGKLTRETGDDESSVELCAFCYHEAQLENALSDGLIAEAEFERDLAALRKQYGRDEAPPADLRGEEVVKLIAAEHAPAKEKTPARAGKAIRITCAVVGCNNEPVEGGTHCAEHTILAMKERVEEPAPPKMTKKEIKEAAKTTCLARGCLEIIPANAPHRRCPKHAEAFMAKAQKIVKKVEREINAQLASPAGKALMAELTAPAATAPAPELPPAAPKAEGFAALAKPEQRQAAMELTRKLVAIGWSVNAQAAATGVTNGSVYRWYRASAAPTPGQFEALQQMLANPPPAAPTAAAGASGTIKAPNARSQAAKASRAPRERDVRQLMLELRDALNAHLAAK